MTDFEKDAARTARDHQLEAEIARMFEDWEARLDMAGLDLPYGVMKGLLSRLFESHSPEEIAEFSRRCAKILWDQAQMIDLNITQENLH